MGMGVNDLIEIEQALTLILKNNIGHRNAKCEMIDTLRGTPKANQETFAEERIVREGTSQKGKWGIL